MSRLQVGGLALVIDDINEDAIGNIVTLVEYLEECTCTFGITRFDMWVVDHESNDKDKTYACYSRNLMPLGDKQTQDELLREPQIEYTK